MDLNFKRLWIILFACSIVGYVIAGAILLMEGEWVRGGEFFASALVLGVGIEKLRQDAIDFDMKTMRVVWFNLGFISMATGLSIINDFVWTFGIVALLASFFGDFRDIGSDQ